MNYKSIFIAIVDDEELIRYVLNLKLISIKGIKILIEAINGKELLDSLETTKLIPDICILDIHMPVMDGYDTIKQLHMKWPTIKVIVLSQYCYDFAIKYMVLNGALAFIDKARDLNELPEIIGTVIQKKFFFNSIIDKTIHERVLNNPININISNSERRILAILCEGNNYESIAGILHISTATVKRHINNLMEKTGTNSKSDLIIFALKNELVTVQKNHHTTL